MRPILRSVAVRFALVALPLFLLFTACGSC